MAVPLRRSRGGGDVPIPYVLAGEDGTILETKIPVVAGRLEA